MSKKNRKNDPGELDVFESSRYFSDFHEVSCYNNNVSTLAQKIMRDERQPWRGGRISLDIPNIRHSLNDSQTFIMENPTTTKERNNSNKYKQPSSPGGKLSSFLNSIFNQAISRKKKSKSTTLSLRDEDESPGGRRRRLRSISNFWSTSSSKKIGPKSPIYPSSTSGCRTPPPYAYAQTKSYKDLSCINHQNVSSFNRVEAKKHEISERKHKDYGFLNAKSRLSNGSNAEKYKSISTKFTESRTSCSSCSGQYISEEKKEFKKFSKVEDDDGDSDSSSDLFELPNFDLDFSSSGLPVYETTNVDSIKRGTPTSSAITR
ncbi:hypothetical protein Leryth_002188 [Lithospermum erythrorhizon]|nr:hypothetical protein Leryth_002188 [Lithospermum erythrorhizon]